MKDKAVIIDIKGTEITVVPIITGACMSCHEKCGEKGHPFTVINSKNLPLEKGAMVKIATSRKAEIIQGFASLFFPVASAIGGFFIAGKSASDTKQACFVLAGLFLASAIVFFISRSKIRLARPHITEICGAE